MSTPASSDVREQVRRILESDVFRSAPQVSRLLTFLTDATLLGEPLKESVIGAAFFNRASGYDPQTDPVVRTEVRRLRLKLNEYYQKEGTAAAILVEIPSGGYKARFSTREVSQPELSPEVLPAQFSLGGLPVSPPPPVPVASAPLVPDRNIAVPKRRVLPWKVLAATVASLAVAAVWLLPRVTGHSATRSVAVFRLRDVNGAGDTAWLGDALSEMLAADLSGTDKLRSIPLDEVDRSRVELALSDSGSLNSAELSQIRQSLGADLVVAGSYASVGTSKEYRIDVQTYDAHTGQRLGSASDTGDDRTLIDMVSRVGAGIGQQVGVEISNARLRQLSLTSGGVLLDSKAPSKVESAKTMISRANSLPNGPDKERLYLQALEIGRKESPGPWELNPLVGLARIYAGQKDFAKGADFYRQAYEVSLKYYGADHANTAEAEVHWARSRTRIGQSKEAVLQVREAILVARKGLPPDSLRYWNVLHDAIHTCNESKAFPDAEAYTLEALKLNENMHLPQTNERWGMLYWDLGRAKKGEKKYGDALAAFQKAQSNFQQFADNRTTEVQADIELVKAEQRGGGQGQVTPLMERT